MIGLIFHVTFTNKKKKNCNQFPRHKYDHVMDKGLVNFPLDDPDIFLILEQVRYLLLFPITVYILSIVVQENIARHHGKHLITQK